MCGLQRANPAATAIAYVGDGGGYAIGGGHLLNAAIRDENILVIVVNNAVYAMTGGQESPTTLPGMKVSTAPCGADSHYMRGPDLIRKVNPTAFVARGITTRQLALRELITDALSHVRANKGFAFLEVLSPCTLNWGTMDRPDKTFEFLERTMAEKYPIKRY
jgi:2-oxoglutarate ferredoxin oxidoreductase subunit beta